MKRFRTVALVVALVFVFGPAAMFALGVRPQAFENRPLAPAPDLAAGWKAFAELGPWASDHLPGRRQAVYANGWVDYYAFSSLPRSAAQKAGAAPTVVRGKNGYLFLGEDFDHYCDDGSAFAHAFARLERLAAVIASSGRQVVFTVAPNKSEIAASDLPTVLPHGACSSAGLTREQGFLQRAQAAHYVDSYRLLAARAQAGDQTFWKTDTHWNGVGSGYYAQAVASQLDPALARRMQLVPGTSTAVKDLIKLAGLDFAETSPTLSVRTGGTVAELPGSESFDPTADHYGINRWQTSPSAGLVQGRSVLIGDSFTYYALPNLRPLFADGSFVWTGHVTWPQMIAQMKASHTVVLEVVQRSVHNYVLAEPAFRAAVARGLGVSGR